MPVVAIAFSPLPGHVRTARLLATTLARRKGLDEDVLDEVRFAVGEACTRAVEMHAQHGVTDPVRMEIDEQPGRLQVDVVDAAPPQEDMPDASLGSGAYDPDALAAPVPRQADGEDHQEFLPAGFGLAVVAGYVDDVEVGPAQPGSGTRVRMVWTLPPG